MAFEATPLLLCCALLAGCAPAQWLPRLSLRAAYGSSVGAAQAPLTARGRRTQWLAGLDLAWSRPKLAARRRPPSRPPGTAAYWGPTAPPAVPCDPLPLCHWELRAVRGALERLGGLR